MVLSLSCDRALAQWEGRQDLLASVEKTFGPPKDAKLLTPKERVWVDRQHGRLIVDGYIAVQEGPLEMLACPVFTKEHESIVALFCKAATVHAGLLAIGARVGKPVQWDPEYRPPSGSQIQIHALWLDEGGERHKIDVRQWIRQAGPGDKHLQHHWVFAGSGFWEDPDSKLKRYLAESGDLICVSNFSTATLDIPTKSTEANAGLLYVAYSSRIPKPGTPVRLVLTEVQPNTEPVVGSTDNSAKEARPEP
ncbi:MAG: hypothetical protein KF752_13140 [Pirellulaceae bacterium]|nr:hypothetical protein [Pirellulaceae bacterium]